LLLDVNQSNSLFWRLGSISPAAGRGRAGEVLKKREKGFLFPFSAAFSAVIEMNLDDTQRQKVAAWIDEGLKLADIQKRLESEFGLRMTYLEVRMLVDDLKLKPKDPPPPPKPAAKPEDALAPPPPLPGKVSVTVDQLTRSGALASGKVKFSDGKTAEWILDQAGRLGLVPSEKGYKPPAADVQEFQIVLQQELQKLGL
jgi:hypothetical protein